MVEPIRDWHRRLTEDPMFTKLNSDRSDPSFANSRTESAEPMFVQSRIELVAPTRKAKLATESVLPNLL
jgi:hypothetical protein